MMIWLIWTHIGVGHRQSEEEGQAPDQQQGLPAVGGGAQGPGPHRVHNHDISKQGFCALLNVGRGAAVVSTQQTTTMSMNRVLKPLEQVIRGERAKSKRLGIHRGREIGTWKWARQYCVFW